MIRDLLEGQTQYCPVCNQNADELARLRKLESAVLACESLDMGESTYISTHAWEAVEALLIDVETVSIKP